MKLCEIIKKIYQDPRFGFKSVLNTYKSIKELHPNLKITKKEVDEVLKSLATHQIHTNQKINKEDYNPITAQQLGFFQLDLIQMRIIIL